MDSGALKGWRKKHGLSQKQLAQALGVSYQAVAHWEQGLRGIPALLPLALEALECRLRKREAQPTTQPMAKHREAQAMKHYEVRMTVYSAVEAGSKQEAKEKVMESLRQNPLINEVWVTQTTEGREKLH